MTDEQFLRCCFFHTGGLVGLLDRVRASLIRGALDLCDGEQSAAAGILGISPRAVGYQLQKMKERPIDLARRARMQRVG